MSGYLIGRIIIRNLVEKGTWRGLTNFYVRRWFRTLPLYYLVVFLLIIFPTGENFTWQNLLFIQNFSEGSLAFNPVSWSLSVEEWFYLTVPFIILAYFLFLNKVKNKGRHFIAICVTLILLSLIARFFSITIEDTFDFGTRKQIFLRLDSLVVGVLLAGIKFYYKEFYTMLINKKRLLFFISLAGIAFCELWFVFNGGPALNASFFSRTIFFNFISIFCAMFILSLETVNFSNKFKVNKVITFISLISYGLYLWHFHVFLILKDTAFNKNISAGLVLLALATWISILISTITYKYFEVPVMKLRDKFKIHLKQ